MTKYNPEKDLPDFAREYKTLQPSKLAEIVLMRRNKKTSPESITMWFKRHPKVHDELSSEIIRGLPTAKQEVDSSIFQTGNFETLPSVKNWLIMLQNRELTQEFINQKIGLLRNVCMGKAHTYDLVAEGKWAFKHPDRLTLQECMEFIAILRERGIDTYHYKRDLKDFMESKDVPVGKRIVVGKPKGFGKYARLYVELDVQAKILAFVYSQNFEAGVVDKFMHRSGTRINATLKAKIEELTEVGNRGIQRVYDKGRRSKYPLGHPWDKYVDAELLTDLKTVIGTRTKGRIFKLTEENMANINKIAIQRFCPEVLEQFPDLYPNHFWRHLFFQNKLRETDWNYTVVAALGGATPQSVEESYGKPPERIVKEWAEKYGWKG
jgi:hypothetical protein